MFSSKFCYQISLLQITNYFIIFPSLMIIISDSLTWFHEKLKYTTFKVKLWQSFVICKLNTVPNLLLIHIMDNFPVTHIKISFIFVNAQKCYIIFRDAMTINTSPSISPYIFSSLYDMIYAKIRSRTHTPWNIAQYVDLHFHTTQNICF